MESQNQEIVASGSPAEVPNDPGKMFIGGLSWQTSPVHACHRIKNEDDQKYLSKPSYFLRMRLTTISNQVGHASSALDNLMIIRSLYFARASTI
ncbi:hypothetical protein HZH68_000962 [Vespula germanica]|uniref:Uncharacterized protein n=1 Tax=Vespula germanica TaxID=30212 RepID=A0A834U698_VESGE|nr:hypothetical protein HZH68_000962 [Vespula germanica]